jgi:acetyl-CoA carboxylase carboxyl transferase beta subunit/acetyl-CoA carboxylase carboxyl transferase alpha subunit
MSESILARINALPDQTWHSCPGCAAVVHHERLARQQHICPECGHHLRLRAEQRVRLLVDADSFEPWHTDLRAEDPLGFVDRMPYPVRLARARAATGMADAALCGGATMGGHPVVLFVLDFAFLGGSMGSVVGELFTRAAEAALARRVPLVAVYASGGARMQEGVLSLVQMAKTAAVVRRLRDAGVPYLSVLTDPVYGGVAASIASLGDVIIAEEGARAGFAGPKVIEQTIRQALPPGFQTARFRYEHGHVDAVVRRPELPGVLTRLVEFCAAAGEERPLPGPLPGPPEPVGDDRDGWEAVRQARAPGRPTTQWYLGRICTGFVELHGDRWESDDPAVIGGVGLLGGTPVVLIGYAKGEDVQDNVRRNFGMPHPAGFRKAIRLFDLAERLRVPVVTLVDTPGAYPGLQAEEGNTSGAIAECLAKCAGLRTPVISVITGEGGSGGALALAVADRLLIQENGIFSVISPEGGATILFGDATRAPDAARALRLRAVDLRRLGVADELIAEPPGGDPADALLAALTRHLADLADLPVDELLDRRYRRLRALGSADVVEPLAKEEIRVYA